MTSGTGQNPHIVTMQKYAEMASEMFRASKFGILDDLGGLEYIQQTQTKTNM